MPEQCSVALMPDAPPALPAKPSLHVINPRIGPKSDFEAMLAMRSMDPVLHAVDPVKT